MALGEDFDRNIQGAGNSARAIARSASFEHRRPATLKSLATSYHPGCQNFSSLSARAEQTERGDKLTAWTGESRQQDKLVSCEKTKQRPLTPSVDPDDLSTMSLDRPHKTTPPAVPKKPSWWNFGRRNSKKEAGVKVALDSTQSSISSSSFGQSSAKQSLTSVSCSSSSPTDSTACKSPKRVTSPASHDANNSISSQGTRQALNDLNMDTTQHVIKSRPCFHSIAQL
ncbi:hypothetical protein EGW08_003424 [Elysia chlorotica]|uniref:Uncharacterized protein n=1 Tax=Elysia chlorotica TaxID=188477 RepID=A0A433U4R5_ELYCH|nr:hypothetical protein EGW08_003424 [Elysia chlorotica]